MPNCIYMSEREKNFRRLPTKLRESYVFRRGCPSFCPPTLLVTSGGHRWTPVQTCSLDLTVHGPGPTTSTGTDI